jgi:hypothetical protein
MPRNIIYCCLRRLDDDNPKKCKKRIEGSARKSKVGFYNFAVYFDEYTGDEACKFISEDVVCPSCNLKVTFIVPLY